MLLLLLCALALLAGCPRDYPAGTDPAATASASYPWDIGNRPQARRPAQPTDPAADEHLVDLPADRGPVLSEEDLVDPALLPGRWLQVCNTLNEQVIPLDWDQMDVMELYSDGKITYHLVRDAKVQSLQGTWEKPRAGMLAIDLGGENPVEVNLQMFGEDFFFYYSYENQQGHWFVRVPKQAAKRISVNRFNTSTGLMEFTKVVERNFEGTVAGEFPRSIAGLYYQGVILMRWTEEQTGATGYAAFRVAPDFSSLDGVWWLNNWEAAPFGGPWSGTAVQ